MILIYAAKFLHLVCALGLMGFTVLISRKIRGTLLILLILSLCALSSGLFLVYPSGFTWHTPWIVAANILLGLFISGICCLYFVKNKHVMAYLQAILMLVLLTIIHDAVTKTSLLGAIG